MNSMAKGSYRVGVFGASSLLGKELADELKESPMAALDVVLLDEEDATGQVIAAGDEATFIQRIEPAALEGMEVAFFAGDAASAAKHWKSARQAGASVVDLTYALERENDVVVRAPWVSEALEDENGLGLNLKTAGVVAAHPATVMLALVLARLKGLGVQGCAATVLEPASEHGREAMDELHQQTVRLLSFQSLPREQYDAQIAFNLLPSVGGEAKVKFQATEERIRAHYGLLSQGRLPELALQLIQAPVFHGYAVSLMVKLANEATVEAVETALGQSHIDVLAEDSDPPSNVSAAGQEAILVRVRAEDAGSGKARRFWLWLAADNLKLAARNAIACAAELGRLRPQGKVQ
jgi:aspartate-semialdehyde dehydrogenase